MSAINESMDMVASIVDASPVGMMLFDNNGILVFANTKAGKIFGYCKSEFRHLNVCELIPSDYREHHQALVKGFLIRPHPRPMGSGRQLTGLTKQKKEIPLEVGLSPLQFGGEQYVLVSVLDISDRARAQALEQENLELTRVATHDELTGLPNRRLLTEFAENSRLLAIRNKIRFTLMFIDLDGFKAINDRYGHFCGDLLLCQVAKALTGAVRKSDVIGRYGGDEFLMSFADNGSFEGAEATANQLLTAIHNIREIEGNPVKVSASIGVISTATPEDTSLEDMIQQADGLMYLAKQNEQGKIVTCDSSAIRNTYFEQDPK